jgi:cystathionine gamma-synthase
LIDQIISVFRVMMDAPLAYPTLLVHADDKLAPTSDVAPALHPSTTYVYPPNTDDWRPIADFPGSLPDGGDPVYSRLSYSTTDRVEKVLGELLKGWFAEVEFPCVR